MLDCSTFGKKNRGRRAGRVEDGDVRDLWFWLLVLAVVGFMMRRLAGRVRISMKRKGEWMTGP